MVNKYVLSMVRCLAVSLALMSFILNEDATASNLGQPVTNVASLSYETPGSEPITVVTNAATFVIEAERTDSTIEFFRYSPNAPDAIMVNLNGADYAPNRNPAPVASFSANGNPPPVASFGSTNESIEDPHTANKFAPMPLPERTKGVPLDISSAVSLIPAQSYFTGELMLVRVQDLGHNGDPTQIETIILTVTTSTGDEICLRLYESGENTGSFWAWVPTTRDPTPLNDTALTTTQNTTLTATYQDSFDSNEITVDTALVDPYGRVFNGLTGDYVDGVRVTLINAKTNQPADVFGIDGISAYPNSVISGQDVTDASGLVYNIRPGEFRFPLAALGQYYVRVEPPEGYSFASSLRASDFTTLPNAPFVTHIDASYGRSFTLAGTGPLNFDIPLDAQTDFILAKTTNVQSADVGDFIPYTITIENRGNAGVPVNLVDTLPRGFKYKKGSSKLNAQTIQDPVLSLDGKSLSYSLGALRAGQTASLTYVLEIGAGAGKAEAVNSVVTVDGNGTPISNIARASVSIREDLLRSTSTLIGRVGENACDGDESWSRNIDDGTGVEGVRLYMETGAYAITDKDGLYNFESLKQGTHVVQIDEETLPKGYEVMVCEESSRFAGRAISQFVEIQGGGLWRANFYLKRNGEAVAKTKDATFNDNTEYKDFDAKWLDIQTAKTANDVEWVYPNPSRTPSTPSVNIGIKHGPNQKVSLRLNGHKVPQENFVARDSNKDRSVMLSRWRGVDLLKGENTFTVVVKGTKGAPTKMLTRKIHFVQNIQRAYAMPDQSVLVADGRVNPILAIRLEDEAGRPVHAGRIADIEVAAPYLLDKVSNLNTVEGAQELVAPNAARTEIVVGADGIARIKLAPTLKTGKATVIVTLDNGRKVELFLYLEPEKRDWIIVGLAEGSVAYNKLKNKTVGLQSSAADGLVRDGRVAFFAKGLVKGNWLMTLAVDTDKRRGDRDSDFQSEIDPNAYYTIYGDRSYNEFEAVSRYPVYLKLEKKTFSAMFGDFSTDITEGKLTRYNRHLSGIKVEYLGETFQSTLYGAETNQGFSKDELAADGTSGPYRLSHANILANSETVTIETRDRVRADVIIESRRMVRHIDYTIDNLSGEIIFRLPVDVSNSGFNTNVIVVDYETAEDAERNLSYGGRIQKQILRGRIQVGSTFVHEGGDGNAAGGQSDMIGADIIAQIHDGTEFRGEFATSRTKQDQSGNYKSSNAYLAEINHTSDRLNAGVYVRVEEGGYGLRQRSTSTSDIRRYGAQVNYVLQEFTDEKTGRRGRRNVSASVYKEDNLGTGASRTLSEVNLSQESERLAVSLGLRGVKDANGANNSQESIQALASIRYSVPKHGLTLQASREQSIGGGQDNNSVDDFPTRTRLSVEKTITDKASIRVSHDILDGANTGGQNTSIGINYAPWAGTAFSLGSDVVSTNGARRIGATIGLDQQFQLNEKWSGSVGVTNRRIFGNGSSINQVAPDIAVSSLEVNESYLAGYVGLGYRNANTSISGRAEYRDASTSEAITLSLSAARELSEDLSFAGAVRATFRNQDSSGFAGVTNLSGRSSRIDSRIGTAWRPRSNDKLVFLNRFDMKLEDATTGVKTTKFVNNFTANTMLNERWQLAGHYGAKYVSTNIDGTTYSGFSHLLGGETRFDVTERIDLGLHGSMLYGHGSDTMSYTFGPSVGISPVDNVWISLGYNVVGYKEPDFTAAEFSQQGAYVKFRLKFDQNTARGLLNMFSPDENKQKKKK